MAVAPSYSSLPSNKVNPFADDIDDHLQKLQNIATVTFIGLNACLVWNTGSVAISWMVGGVETKILFLAMAYLVCGLPAANWLWYNPLCQALRTENTSKLRYFFHIYQFHISFCIFAAISPPVFDINGRSLTGILSALDISGDNEELGFLYFIGFGCFSLESILSIWVMQIAYTICRRRDINLELTLEMV